MAPKILISQSNMWSIQLPNTKEIDMSKESREQQKRAFHLNITVKGSRNSIYISKDVIRALGVPTYVCIKINEDMSSLAIEPGEEKEYMAFKVPRNCSTAINMSSLYIAKALYRSCYPRMPWIAQKITLFVVFVFITGRLFYSK